MRVYAAEVSKAEAGSLTTEDLCTILQVSRPVVQQLLRSGSLPGVRPSRKHGWSITPAAFETWILTQYADTRAWLNAHPSPATGMWDRDTGGPTP